MAEVATSHTLSVLVENKPGVLARVSSLIFRRGFNIESLAVGPTEYPHMSRITLAVTVEPCTMCAGAIGLARVSRVVFGAWEPRTGAVGSLWDVLRDRRLNHRPEVVGGVLEAECASLMESFFLLHRETP